MRYQDDTSDLLGLGGHVDRKKFDYDEDFDFENFLKVKDMTVGFWRKIGRDPGFVKRPERGARIQRLSRVLRNELGRMMRFAGEGGNEVFLATTVCDELKKKGVLECAHLAESHVGEGFGGGRGRGNFKYPSEERLAEQRVYHGTLYVRPVGGVLGARGDMGQECDYFVGQLLRVPDADDLDCASD